MKLVIGCVLLLAACSKPDDCEKLFNSLARSMKDSPMPKGKSIADEKDKFVAECRKNPDKMKSDPQMQCVLAAKTEADEAACWVKAFDGYVKASKATEASLLLNMIAKRAKAAYGETSAFPIGKAKMLPAAPADQQTGKGCCGGKAADGTVNNKCPASAEWAADPVWKALDVSVDEPSSYRYTYESTDGKSFTATAVGDLDCDGHEAIYTATGTLDAAGNPSVNVTKPQAGVY